MKKLFCIIVVLTSFIYADALKCEKKENRIICTYFSDRSDSDNDIVLKFHWISPKTPNDDRIREINIPPYYGSAYDYRFIPGRVPGHWMVKVTQEDTNKSVTTSFDINESDDEFFSN